MAQDMITLLDDSNLLFILAISAEEVKVAGRRPGAV
jgi:hypothetical protein